jgi:hypothetical protein
MPRIFAVLVMALSWAPGLRVAPASEPQAPAAAAAEAAAIEVTHDPEVFRSRIAIRATEGRVAWADVIRGFSLARGYDAAALEGVLPRGSFALDSVAGRATRTALNVALSPGIRFDAERPADGGQSRLIVQLDRTALLASQRRLTARIRRAFERHRPPAADRGLQLDEGWQEAAADRSIVVLLHGLDAQPEDSAAFRKVLRAAGHPTGAFRYPNDQAVADSGRLLSTALKQLAKDHPQRHVALVAHSLGALVARVAIEDPALDPGNVRQLIMVGPPNHGSALARFEFALDLGEHLTDAVRRKELAALSAMIEDGMSEAGADLTPDSPFLRELNRRPRNAKVQYSNFLGTRGPLTRDELDRLRQRLTDKAQNSRWLRFFGPRLDGWLADLDEVVEGQGDGAVALKRGRLDGVEDVVVGHWGHVGALQARRDDELAKLWQQIADRLATGKAAQPPAGAPTRE